MDYCLRANARSGVLRRPVRERPRMYDIYFWTTPNGYKILLFAEEAGLSYTIKPINIGQGEQFAPHFLRLLPSHPISAIVDHAPGGGKTPHSGFASPALPPFFPRKNRKYLPL